MRRYWVEPESIHESDVGHTDVGHTVELTEDSFHHIVHVCRNELGSKFEVLCGTGTAYFVELTEIKKKSATAKILETRAIPALREPHITLCISIPKFAKFETILEKSVELGAHSVIPFVSAYSFVRATAPVKEKFARFRKIILGATQQCGRGDVMELHEPAFLDQVLEKFNRSPDTAGLFPYEGGGEQDVRRSLQELKVRKPKAIWVFVGSEGGFSTDEVLKFQGFNLRATTLGPEVLRVETACLALLSVIKYEMDLMR